MLVQDSFKGGTLFYSFIDGFEVVSLALLGSNPTFDEVSVLLAVLNSYWGSD